MRNSLWRSALLAIAGAGLMAGNAMGMSITNGGFETGDLTGWTPTTYGGNGAAIVTTSSTAFDGTVYTATEGDYFAELTAGADIVQTDISWQAGQTVEFDWAFLAQDYQPFNDFSFFTVMKTNGSSPATAVHSVTLASVTSVGDYNDVGWNTYSYTFITDGSGYLQFGVYDEQDNQLSSQFLLDNVHQPTPEPATMVLFGTGLLGLAGVARRRKANK